MLFRSELVAMDPANVAMVVFKLLSSCFTEYDVKEEQEIALNLGNLKQILRRAKPNDTLTLELKDNKLNIQLKGTSTRTFSLPILELEEKEQKIPDLTFPVSIKTTTDIDRKSTRLNSSHTDISRMPSSA